MNNDVWGFLTAVITAFGIVLAAFFRGWIKGTPEEQGGTPERRVIIEQGEIADLTAVTRLLADIKPRLEQLYDVEKTNHQMLEENRTKIEEALRGIRRLESELDVAKRLREERLLEARRPDRNSN